jgi:hypothetical protein
MLQKNQDDFYTFSSFLKFPELICATSTRKQGNLKGKVNFSDFKKFIKKLGHNFNFVQFEQVHGSKVVRVEGKMTNKILPDCDGGVTKEKKLLLAVFVADCFPILVYDQVKKIVGIAHAGWKGIKSGIAQNLIGQMQALGSKPCNVIIGVGPGICGQCYEVGQGVASQFDQRFSRKRDGKILLDLERAIVEQLIQSGIKKENIERAGICVFEDENFFSARREGEIARIAVVIGLR